jgi:hypothetical protein
MAVVNQVDKIAKLNKKAVVQFQILTHCFLSGIVLSSSELECLTFLAETGENDLNNFCTVIHGRKIFKSPQSARNAIAKAEKNSLVIKQGKSKKKIWINPLLKIQTDGNILLNYKFLAIETV